MRATLATPAVAAIFEVGNNNLQTEAAMKTITGVRVHDRNGGYLCAELSKQFPDLKLSTTASEVDPAEAALITFEPPKDENIGRYVWIHSTGAGVDAILRALSHAGEQQSPVVTRTLGSLGQQIAEYCLCYALAFLQNVATRAHVQGAKIWDRNLAAPSYLFSKKVVVIGTGHIGQRIAEAFSPLAREVHGIATANKSLKPFQTVTKLAHAAEVLRGADVVILALPNTDKTVHLFNRQLLASLNGALIINVGRGSTLCPGSLRMALDSGSVAHAVLDVFESEPLALDSWLWRHPAVTVTPHVAGLTQPQDAVHAFSQQLNQLLQTGELQSTVDSERGY